MFLLSVYGEEKYPGIRDAIASRKIYICRKEDLEASVERYEQDGYILLGFGGSRYDEHGVNGNDPKKGECCASLVAKDLGVDKLPELAKILRFVNTSDQKKGVDPNGMKIAVDLINAQSPNDPFEAIDFAFKWLRAKHAEQYDFHVSAKQAVEKARREEFETATGKKLRMVTVVTNSETAVKYIRSENGGGADIIIQQNTRGQVQIFPDEDARIDMTDTAQILRFVEQEQKNRVVTTEWKLLAAEGEVKGAEEWYFYKNLLLNGSLTDPNKQPTKIPLVGIQSLVKIGVSGMFEPSRAQKCTQGICTSSPRNPCKWYDFGLERCREVRRFQHHQKAVR